MGMIMLNGIAYTSTDGARDFPPLIYSTEEQEVGVWTDGKPLYQKTITGVFASGSTSLTLNMSSNMGIVINISGFLIPSDTPTNKVSLETKNDLVWIHDFNTGSGNVTIRRGNSGYFGDTPSVYITAQYTKTTDTPGSGKWSAFGGGSNVIHEEYFEWQRGTSTTTAESMRYTAPCDGWVTVLQYMDKNNDVYCCVEGVIYNPNTNITKQVDIDDGRQRYHTWHLGFPAKRGDVIIIKTRLDSGTLPTSATFRFIG